MSGLVARAAAGDQRDGARGGRHQAGPDHDVLGVEQGKARLKIAQALEHLAHHGAWLVDQLFHGTSTALPTTVRSSISLNAFTQSQRSKRPAT